MFIYPLVGIAAMATIKSDQTSHPKPLGNPGIWVSKSDYPSEDLLAKNEGTTSFQLTVGKDGRVSKCVITRSSGFSSLDKITCEKVTLNANFQPAKNKLGNSVVGQWSNRVRWNLTRKFTVNQGAPENLTKSIQLKFIKERDGTISNCQMTVLKGNHEGPSPCENMSDRFNFPGGGARLEFTVTDNTLLAIKPAPEN